MTSFPNGADTFPDPEIFRWMKIEKSIFQIFFQSPMFMD